jgi:twitching motility protein PilT
VRVTLSFVLLAVVSQTLIPKVGGGRAMAMEIMVCTPAIRALIRDDKVHQIYSLMQAGQKYGMITLNQSLAELYLSRKITLQDAQGRSSNVQELNDLLARKQPQLAGTAR